VVASTLILAVRIDKSTVGGELHPRRLDPCRQELSLFRSPGFQEAGFIGDFPFQMRVARHGFFAQAFPVQEELDIVAIALQEWVGVYIAGRDV